MICRLRIRKPALRNKSCGVDPPRRREIGCAPRVAMAATGGVKVAVCAYFPPKLHDGNPDAAVPDLLCDVWKQQVARLRQRAIQMLQLGGVSILLLFQVP
jgi:hypothetical protein